RKTFLMNLQPIFWGGLIAGTLDICAAFLTAWLRAGVGPGALLRFVASGLLGPAAAQGGAKVALFGLASRKWRLLIERPVMFGLLYGIAVYTFMNFVVLPLSLVAQRPRTAVGTTIGLLTIMFCIGLPIALIVG